MLYWFQCVCLSGTEIRVIRLSTQVDTMFWGVLDHLVDVRPSVCPSVCLSVHPSVRLYVRPFGQTSVQAFTWQLRSHLQVTQGPKLSTTEYQAEYHIEYHWVPKLSLPDFHFECLTKSQWVSCWVLLSTTLSTTEYHIEYHIEYHWVQCGRYKWWGERAVWQHYQCPLVLFGLYVQLP